jgi:AbrB family looped-hinge helix DNA binding protein
MEVVTVTKEYQVNIPDSVRRSLNLQPGQQVQVLVYENRIEYIPLRSVQSARGILEGIDTSVPRDADRV